MGAFDDFLDDDFMEDLYPPYNQVVKDVKNLSDFAFIKADLQRLKEYIIEINSLLDIIKQYKEPITYLYNLAKIYNSVAKIKDDAITMKDIILNIRSNIQNIPNYDTFDTYLWRIQSKAEDIIGIAGILLYKIRSGQKAWTQLTKITREIRKKLDEIESFIDLVNSYF